MKRRGITQSAYGAPYGLSQSQISELVRGKLSEVTPALTKMLRERIGEIPELSSAPEAIEDEIAEVMQRVESEIRRALRNAPPERHARIIEHIEGQVTLLADLAAGGGPIELATPAPTEPPAVPAAARSLRRPKTIATVEARRHK